LAEQLGGLLPATLVLPVGNGTLVLGAHLALGELAARGHPDRPRIVAVQAEACAPLAEAFAAGAAEPAPVEPSPTVAEGIAIARPARGGQILAAVRDTGGDIVTVSDEQVLCAQADLAGRGLYVEPTAAVCWAAVRAGLVPAADSAGGGTHTVLPLCGSGLKSG
jgi:threonine synthase